MVNVKNEGKLQGTKLFGIYLSDQNIIQKKAGLTKLMVTLVNG